MLRYSLVDAVKRRTANEIALQPFLPEMFGMVEAGVLATDGRGSGVDNGLASTVEALLTLEMFVLKAEAAEHMINNKFPA